MKSGSRIKKAIALGLLSVPPSLFAGTMGLGAEQDLMQGAFYLRGDIGYNILTNPQATTAGAPLAYPQINAANAKVNNQFGYNVGVGYQFMPQIRGDLTLTYRPAIKYQLTNLNATTSGKLKNYTFMVNGYYDVPTNWVISPYVMAGLGFSSNETNSIYWPVVNFTEGANKISHFAWQIGLGGYYPISTNFFVDFSYQFIDLGSFSNSGLFSNGTYTTSPTHFNALYSNQLQGGLRYQFG